MNQSAALIFCSLKKARELGVAESEYVFPLVTTENSHVVPLSERPILHRHSGIEECAKEAFAHTKLTSEDIDFYELYSCFPSAVQGHSIDIGVPEGKLPTQMGGMAFYGGPLNNYVMQMTAKMAIKLKANPEKVGLVSTISGINGKQGAVIYSSKAPEVAYADIDVTEQAKTAMPPLQSIKDYEGEAKLLAATVVFKKTELSHAFAVAETPDGKRLVCVSNDHALMQKLTEKDWNGSTLVVAADGSFELK